MLYLNQKALSDTAAWEKAGIALPTYDRAAMIAKTKAEPRWLHFGAGNIFRAFIALVQQRLLEQGLQETGIVAVDTSRGGAPERISAEHDHLALSVGLRPDGTTAYSVAASIADCLRPCL